jgi:hypothetical protein
MARAKANPDPAVEEYSANGHTFHIEAGRDGSYLVRLGERTLINRPAQIGAHFGAPRWPSNRLQAEALEEARQRARTLRDDQL